MARVLLVDDHRDTADMLGSFLKRCGFETTVCHSLAEALGCADQPWDAVVSDVALRDGSGLDLARRFGHGGGRKPRLIALTGRGSPADREATRAAGFDEHLVKPVDPKRLLTLLRA